MVLDIAQILAVIPIPPVFMLSPFVLDGARSWLGWVDVVLTLLLILGLSFLGMARMANSVLAIVVGIALLVFWVVGILKAFGVLFGPENQVPPGDGIPGNGNGEVTIPAE